MDNKERATSGVLKLEHGYDKTKTFESKNGFTVLWLNAVGTVLIKPGIYIRFCGPNKFVKEETFFEFEDEDKAQAKFDSHVATAKRWENIK
jgi:hypothetical protein